MAWGWLIRFPSVDKSAATFLTARKVQPYRHNQSTPCEASKHSRNAPAARVALVDFLRKAQNGMQQVCEWVWAKKTTHTQHKTTASITLRYCLHTLIWSYKKNIVSCAPARQISTTFCSTRLLIARYNFEPLHRTLFAPGAPGRRMSAS